MHGTRKPKLCIKNLDRVFERMRNNVRWKYIFRHEKEDNSYIPGLYIKSENEPDKALDEMEERMNCYEKEIGLLRKDTTAIRYILISLQCRNISSRF